MSAKELVFLVFSVAGGMSLFIFGMHVMTKGLRDAAGSALRTILAGTTRNRMNGITLGAALGFLAHSGAATTMIAGFVNAGLMGLPQSVAPMLGANVGTSWSMQLISFDLGKYAWAAIAIGFLTHALIPNPRLRELGHALLGFGLLFLGMTSISASIAPYRDFVAPWLQHIEGATWTGRLSGVAFAALLTALMTSSGAMIGLCFALITAGVLTDFDSVFPIVMGSHIGTCIVAVTASFSMNIEARRSALAHLAFNVFNVALALALYPVIKAAVLETSPHLVRQVANLHVIVMMLAAAVLLPVSPWFGRLMRTLLPSRQPPPEPSYLDEDLLEKPEQALCATVRELRRMARLCVEGMNINGELMLAPNPALVRKILNNEAILDEVKDAVGDYLSRLTRRYLSRRQTLFLQHIDRCMKDIERIGDHLTNLSETSVERLAKPAGIVPKELFDEWFTLFCAAKTVLVLTEKSLDPDQDDFQTHADAILKARDQYMILSMDAKAEFAGAVAEKKIPPLAGYFFNRYIADLDRLVRHARTIAFAEQQREFMVKRRKLTRVVAEVGGMEAPPLVDPKDYLTRLYEDSVLDTEESTEIPEPHPEPKSTPENIEKETNP